MKGEKIMDENKIKCPDCDGAGWYRQWERDGEDFPYNYDDLPCDRCNQTGLIDRDSFQTWEED